MDIWTEHIWISNIQQRQFNVEIIIFSKNDAGRHIQNHQQQQLRFISRTI